MLSVLQAEDLGLAGRFSQGEEEGVKYKAGKIYEIVFDVLSAMAEAEGHEHHCILGRHRTVTYCFWRIVRAKKETQ